MKGNQSSFQEKKNNSS